MPPNISQDKLLHIVAGAIATLPGLLIGWEWAIATCAVAAVAREVYNRHKGGAFDLADIAATLAGGHACR